MKTITPTSEGVWTPAAESIADTNVAWLMHHAGVDTYAALHAWSVQQQGEAYWSAVLERLGIRVREPYQAVVDFSAGPESPNWLPGEGQVRIR